MTLIRTGIILLLYECDSWGSMKLGLAGIKSEINSVLGNAIKIWILSLESEKEWNMVH